MDGAHTQDSYIMKHFHKYRFGYLVVMLASTALLGVNEWSLIPFGMYVGACVWDAHKYPTRTFYHPRH